LASAFMMGSTFQSSAVATDLGSFEMSFNTCGGYTKPATCEAQPHCTWRGSCVPR
jgi:hypothetical protein